MSGFLSRAGRYADLFAAGAVVLVVAMLVIPLPPFLIDLFITLNISVSLMIVVATLYVPRALDFSSFPSLLLLTTLFRLAINVSVTRLILLHGDAGHVVTAFGNFVVGGNVVVGLVVFMILIIIQFVVITAGAGRVAEVGARFTLDAMPGKQMAIDADLNTGQITDEQARKRRSEISQEADFYGAMDGASKFVKGEAVAGILIVLVNLIGGIIVGVMQQGMPFGQAATQFSLLTVGDGLCAQIPRLLISVATGILVTRSASEQDLGNDVAASCSTSAAPRSSRASSSARSRSCPRCPSSPSSSSAGSSSPWAGRCATRRTRPSARPRPTRRPPARPPRCPPRRATRPSRPSSSTRSSWRSASAWSRSSTRAPAARCWPASASSAARSPRARALSSGPVRIRETRPRDSHEYVMRVRGVEVARRDHGRPTSSPMDPGRRDGPARRRAHAPEPAFGPARGAGSRRRAAEAEASGDRVGRRSPCLHTT
jgi:flagellar biosynthesis protein FlhA